MKVLILGSGPAGLVAAHASKISGCEIEIISLGRRSMMHGAQYLHSYIPGVPGIGNRIVDTELRGSVVSYRQKVYGEGWKGQVSPMQFAGPSLSWDIRATYDWLWDEYDKYITPFPVDGEVLNTIIPLSDYDVVFNTIPADRICKDPSHKFDVQKIWAAGDAPEWKMECPVRVRPQTVVLNGNSNPSWYRCSNVFGHCTAEWPWNGGKKPPIAGINTVRKPLQTSCDCWPNIHRLGRYGKWQKGQLVHQVFPEVLAALRARVG